MKKWGQDGNPPLFFGGGGMVVNVRDHRAFDFGVTSLKFFKNLTVHCNSLIYIHIFDILLGNLAILKKIDIIL